MGWSKGGFELSFPKQLKIVVLAVVVFLVGVAVWWYGFRGDSRAIVLPPMPSVPDSPVAGRLFAIEADYLLVATPSIETPVSIPVTAETRYRFAEPDGTFAVRDRSELELGDQLALTVVNENSPYEAFEMTVYPKEQE